MTSHIESEAERACREHAAFARDLWRRGIRPNEPEREPRAEDYVPPPIFSADELERLGAKADFAAAMIADSWKWSSVQTFASSGSRGRRIPARKPCP